MNTRRVDLKVPGGKLLRVKSEVTEGKISFIRVTGDFFMTPEEDLERLEEALIGQPADPEAIERFINKFFAERHTVITGAYPSDFARIISESIKL
ncbi:hypothetical protein KEJ47_07340 [Candidatus Bathyarchaeota archaeon]|nr:hypothetical protein [Candidatus Bathyarchaeota archaeon]